MKKATALLILFPVVLIAAIYFFSKKPVKKPIEKAAEEKSGSQLEILGEKREAEMQPTVVLKTSLGEITLELNAKQTPITVDNFVSLVRKGFYNNTVFHRVIAGFMIQGGDPNGDGTGGPGYKFNDEPFEGEYARGTIAMANAGPNTNGSQFFIMHQDYPLPKNYVIFGKVVSGIEVVDKIAEAPVTANAMGETSKPVTPVKVESAEVIEK